MIKKRILKSGVILIASLLFFVNSITAQTALKIGFWEGFLQLNDSTELSFNFEIKNNNQKSIIEIINADERIKVDEISFVRDSVFIKMPVFDSEFKCKLHNDTLKGIWINHSRKEKNVIPFRATKIILKELGYRTGVNFNVDGKWECNFNPNTVDEYNAVGDFQQLNNIISGTFQTETGDYRYLQGEIKEGKVFYLSCFDGAHAFLFTGKIKGDSIVNGNFYSGAHWHELWVAVRNDKFELRNPDSLTYLKSGYSKIDFSFKNLEGKTISLNDEKFKNKVVIVQLMGSWCPNCMDETKFLAPFYEKYKSQGLEIIGLAFERTDDFEKAVSNVKRLKNKFNANYEFLITMKTGAQQASEALPMLNKVMAFPTTIYIDRSGVVKKIYTGYYGPATGSAYTKYVEQTNLFVEKLLKE